MSEETCEFGEGLAYCLGLFLAHETRIDHFRGAAGPIDYGLWFNAAADHLFHLRVDYAPPGSEKIFGEFRDKCLKFRLLNDVTEADCLWAIGTAKILLRIIDRALGVPVRKGEWE